MQSFDDSGLTPPDTLASPRASDGAAPTHHHPRILVKPGTARIEDLVEGTRLCGEILVPPSVFDPADPWAQAFRRGLAKLEGVKGTWYEVGVGAGVNIAAMLETHHNIVKIYGSDYVAETTEVAKSNVAGLQFLPDRFQPLAGSIDILTSIREHAHFNGQGKFDGVFACIPQVAYPKSGVDIKDAPAHYFDFEAVHFDPKLDACFLGLQEKLLYQARGHLPQGGRAVLNLAGRVPLETLFKMFDEFGYDPEIIHREPVMQHAGTSIEELVHAESMNGIEFTFYESPACTGSAINATTAQRDFLDKHCHVYHELYVIQGTLRDHYATT